MEPQCDSFCAQVNPDASHLVARPAEIDTASAAERGFPGPNRSAGTGGRPSAPTHAAPLGCTHPSSTAARDRSASTPPPGIRICRSTAIVRRPWARCLSHGTTSKVRVELKSPILIRRGSSPVAAAGLVSYTIWARCRSFSQQRIIAQPVLHFACRGAQRLTTTDHDRSTTITLVHRTYAVAVGHTTHRFDSRPRLMTLSSYTKPRAKAGITRLLDTVHIPVSEWKTHARR
jgi:hypothetical protein